MSASTLRSNSRSEHSLRKHTMKKRILFIHNFKGEPTGIDQNYINQASKILNNGISDILYSNENTVYLETMFKFIENLYQFDQNRALIGKLENLLTDYLNYKLKYFLDMDDAILPNLDHFCKQFLQKIIIIKNIYLYYDRSFKNNCQKPVTVQEMSMNLLKNIIITNPEIKNRYLTEILYYICQERSGVEVNTNYISSILTLLLDLKLYNDIFLMEFVSVSENFYNAESKLTQSMTVHEYLNHVQRRIFEEELRATRYVNETTKCVVLDILYKYLINNRLDSVLDAGFRNMLDSEDIEDLRVLYRLAKKVYSGLKTLSAYFQDYALNRTTQIVNDGKNMIQELINFKDKLDRIVEQSFKSSEKLQEIIRNCFIKAVNLKQNKSAQLLAKYLDNKLRCKDISEERLETIMTKAMVLFRFIQGKDIFEAFYKKHLAKRLLFGKSTSQDAEDSIVAKLKGECGAGFTAKIEGMFKDINVSKGINVKFKQHLSTIITEDANNTDFSINVLTSSFWPTYPVLDVHLPEDLGNIQMIFHKFHTNTHSGRKLFWQPGLGSCVVKAVLPRGNKELQLSLFQTLVLLLFNDVDRLSYSEILEQTALDAEELKRTLLSLSCGKNRILLKEPRQKFVVENDSFILNKDFTDKLFRIKINQIQLRETVEEQKATEDSVLADRQFQIDAAIVRILKKKKTVNHNELLSDLFNVLDIPVKPYDLKKRIEMLIDREYLARDTNNLANYIYIA